MKMKHHLRKMTFEGKSYNVLTDEELEDLIVSEIYDRCKSQYKNVGLGQYKNVGFPTFLYCLFSLHLL